ncbi:MAG: hypothetical protein HY913_05635 [Desulfomonile tiedjei]|nr:hypothetical protein [Desulfomonile tiedjei]
MRIFTVLLMVVALGVWGTGATAVDMNRVEGPRIWKCMQDYQRMDQTTRDKMQPGQTGTVYLPLPTDIRRACQLVPSDAG